ncbi:MAG: DUF4339 domain-containing protein [Xanthobacteraceae bacterium]
MGPPEHLLSGKPPAEGGTAGWYYVDGTGETGPFTAEEFKEKIANSVGTDQFFWCDGMSEWKRVEEFRAIFAARSQGPPTPVAPTRMMRKRDRGYVRQICERVFIGFNLLMVIWLVFYWMRVFDQMVENQTGKADVYTETAIFLLLWVVGDAILGIILFFARGSKPIDAAKA